MLEAAVVAYRDWEMYIHLETPSDQFLDPVWTVHTVGRADLKYETEDQSVAFATHTFENVSMDRQGSMKYSNYNDLVRVGTDGQAPVYRAKEGTYVLPNGNWARLKSVNGSHVKIRPDGRPPPAPPAEDRRNAVPERMQLVDPVTGLPYEPRGWGTPLEKVLRWFGDKVDVDNISVVYAGRDCPIRISWAVPAQWTTWCVVPLKDNVCLVFKLEDESVTKPTVENGYKTNPYEWVISKDWYFSTDSYMICTGISYLHEWDTRCREVYRNAPASGQPLGCCCLSQNAA